MTETARLLRVSSRQNALVKEVRRAFGHGELTPDGYCAIESVRLIEEAIRSGLRFKAVLFSAAGEARAGRLLPQLGNHVQTLVLSDEVFASAVATESPQGVAALVKLKESSLDRALGLADPLVVVVAGLQDPGNVGTLLRSAEAFGATGVVLGEGTVSALNPKVVRASAGSLFRLNLVRGELAVVCRQMRERGVRLVATSSHKGVPLAEADLRGPLALLIGNEGAGLGRDTMGGVDVVVSIPHAAQVESLNAGVAGSVILYEIARQRRA